MTDAVVRSTAFSFTNLRAIKMDIVSSSNLIFPHEVQSQIIHLFDKSTMQLFKNISVYNNFKYQVGVVDKSDSNILYHSTLSVGLTMP